MEKLWLRLKSETPIFWKKVRKFAMNIGFSAVAVWLINAQMSLELSVLITSICKYTIVVCAAITGMSSFTTTNPNL